MILPEDPEKEALQRQLDAAQEFALQVRESTESGNGQEEAGNRISNLSLPPPPYNPESLQRGLGNGISPRRGEQERSSIGLSSSPNDLGYRTPSLASLNERVSTYPPYHVEASTSQSQLPSTQSLSMRTFETESGILSRRRSFQREETTSIFSGLSSRSQASLNPFARNDVRGSRKGKERSWRRQTRSRFALIPDSWGWRQWSRKTWVLILLFSLLVVCGTVGGLIGGLSVGRQNEERIPKYAAAGNRIVVPWDSNGYLTFDPMKDGPPTEDGSPQTCNTFEPLANDNILRSVAFAPYGQNITYATFYLDKNATSLFIHAKGDSTSGSVQIVGIEDYDMLQAGQTPKDQVRVDVVRRMGNNATDSLVCQMGDTTGRQGVGIYTQSLSTHSPDEVVAGDPNLSFFILVRFPPPSNVPFTASRKVNVSAVFDLPDDKLPSLEVTTDQMGLRIGYMKGLVSLEDMQVNIGRGLISAEYVAADTMTLQTRTSSLWGTFNITDRLTMNTTSGSLLADVILHNPLLSPSTSTASDGESVQPRGKYLRVSSPAYEPGMQPPSAQGDYTGGSDPELAPINPITVRAQTTNGPLVLSYLSQAPGIVLDSAAFTSNGEASTRTNAAFQGSFLLRSVNGDLRIPESNDLQPTDNGILNFADPWGRDRRRVITFDQGNNTAFGQNLTSTGDDSRSPWGYTRGDSVYNKAAGSFQVAGVTMWLTPQEVERAVNLSQTAMAVAQECADLICSGYAAMRSSKVLTQTSWGGGELTFT